MSCPRNDETDVLQLVSIVNALLRAAKLEKAKIARRLENMANVSRLLP